MFLGHSFQESHVFEHSVTGRRAFVPERKNKFSQAGITTETSGCGVGQKEGSLNPRGKLFHSNTSDCNIRAREYQEKFFFSCSLTMVFEQKV